MLIFLRGGVVGAQSSSETRVLQAVRISGEIQLDGRLDEPEWELAEPAKDFIQKLPDTGAPATEPTEVRVLYNDEYLYIGAYCFDSAGPAGIVVNDITRDFFTLDSDGFQVVLDTFDDNRNAFLFGTNPRAGKFDMQIGSDGNAGNVSWDGIWFVETQITQEGWIVEMAIPFRTLRFSGDPVQVWGINFERRVRRKFEDSYWSPIPPPYRLGRVSLAGRLEGLEGIHPGRNLWVKPYVTTPILRRENDDVDFEPDVGLDVKYGVTSQMTLDLTWNTDFSQVEADEEQINLTRFSLFFPEKREFFLENASVFEWGRRTRQGPRFRPDLLPFFSRRIGIAENEEGDNVLVPILGGARLTGRTGKYTLGLLAMRTGEADGIPESSVAVARVRRDLLSQSDVGAIYTQKTDAGGETSRTYGADLHFNFFRYLDITTYALKTDNPGIEGEDTAANFEVSWVDELFDVQVGHLRIEENFDPALGFVAREGVNRSRARVELTPRPGERIPWIREFNPSVEIEYFTNPDGILETRRIEPRFSVIFSDSSRISFAVEDSFERLLEPFEIRESQFISEGDFHFREKSLFFRSDPSRLLSAELRWGSGTFFDGDRDRYGVELTITPSYRFSTRLSWDHNDLDLPSGAFSTDLAGLRMKYAFSNRMFFDALIQYNSEDDEILSNLRFNFIHHPLSDLYIVYNERREPGGGVIDRGFVVKLTHLFAF
ncbi:MAG: hypothetical protein Kow00109_14470 [Acidobacteriota bacterium]